MGKEQDINRLIIASCRHCKRDGFGPGHAISEFEWANACQARLAALHLDLDQ